MNFEPNPTQEAFRLRAKEFADDVLRNVAPDLERGHTFPLQELKQMAALGLMGVNVRAEYGGAAQGVVAYSLAVSEIAKADPAVAVTMCVNNMVGEVIQEFGTPAQRSAHVSNVADGTYAAGSFCLSEPGSGSDAAGMTTTALEDGDSYVLNGTKAWITSGDFAGVYIVWAKVGEGAGRDTISAFLVDPTSAGVSSGKPESKMGQHASNTVLLSFDDVRIPKHALLGEIGHGFRIAMMALDGGRIGIGSQALGIAQEALSILESHGQVQAAQALRPRVQTAQLLVHRAAWLKEQKDRNFTKEASMAKLFASETACAVCEGAIAALGTCALLPDMRLEKLLRDARVTRIYEGTSEVQRIVISREVLKAS